MGDIVGWVVQHPKKKRMFCKVNRSGWVWYKHFIGNATIFSSKDIAETYCVEPKEVRPVTTNDKGNLCLYKGKEV